MTDKDGIVIVKTDEFKTIEAAENLAMSGRAIFPWDF